MMSGEKKDLPDDVKLFDMMDQLGMEPAGAPVPRFGHMLASAYHTCQSCQSVEECREWLAAAAAEVEVARRSRVLPQHRTAGGIPVRAVDAQGPLSADPFVLDLKARRASAGACARCVARLSIEPATARRQHRRSMTRELRNGCGS